MAVPQRVWAMQHFQHDNKNVCSVLRRYSGKKSALSWAEEEDLVEVEEVVMDQDEVRRTKIIEEETMMTVNQMPRITRSSNHTHQIASMWTRMTQCCNVVS